MISLNWLELGWALELLDWSVTKNSKAVTKNPSCLCPSYMPSMAIVADNMASYMPKHYF